MGLIAFRASRDGSDVGPAMQFFSVRYDLFYNRYPVIGTVNEPVLTHESVKKYGNVISSGNIEYFDKVSTAVL
jgi:hypothetical protein